MLFVAVGYILLFKAGVAPDNAFIGNASDYLVGYLTVYITAVLLVLLAWLAWKLEVFSYLMMVTVLTGIQLYQAGDFSFATVIAITLFCYVVYTYPHTFISRVKKNGKVDIYTDLGVFINFGVEKVEGEDNSYHVSFLYEDELVALTASYDKKYKKGYLLFDEKGREFFLGMKKRTSADFPKKLQGITSDAIRKLEEKEEK